jgi:cell division septation protein DedD
MAAAKVNAHAAQGKDWMSRNIFLKAGLILKPGLFLKPSLAGLALLCATPALADVKAGVDAWSLGDYAAAIGQWRGPAAAGDADAQFNLAQAYKLGRGVKQDMAMAEALFAKAAAQGHMQASDNYGLLLFQRGQRAQAMPYIRAAADRGDPRSEYLLGIAHFNGDNVPKDWVRAYALVSLAQQGGLAQAASALTQMDQHVPLEQRQAAVALSAELASQAEATRARQMAAVDLGATVQPGSSTPPATAIRTPVPRAPTIVAAQDAVAAAARVAGTDSPRTAGADYARPSAPVTPTQPRPVVAAPLPRPTTATPPRPTAVAIKPPTPVTPPAAANGQWRIQLGAFTVASNADALWNRVRSRPEVSGHPRLMVASGKATKLQAGGYASQDTAQTACSRLSAAGFTCMAVRN